MLCCLCFSWTKVKVKNVDPLNSTGSLFANSHFFSHASCNWICRMNKPSRLLVKPRLYWIKNKDYHLMHRGVKPAFIKVWSILTHPIFKCCHLTSLKSYFTLIINLYKRLNPNISSICNFNCFANILQMPYWFFFVLGVIASLLTCLCSV